MRKISVSFWRPPTTTHQLQVAAHWAASEQWGWWQHFCVHFCFAAILNLKNQTWMKHVQQDKTKIDENSRIGSDESHNFSSLEKAALGLGAKPWPIRPPFLCFWGLKAEGIFTPRPVCCVAPTPILQIFSSNHYTSELCGSTSNHCQFSSHAHWCNGLKRIYAELTEGSALHTGVMVWRESVLSGNVEKEDWWIQEYASKVLIMQNCSNICLFFLLCSTHMHLTDTHRGFKLPIHFTCIYIIHVAWREQE